MTDPRPKSASKMLHPEREPIPASPLSEERVREYEQMLAAVTPGPWMIQRWERRLSEDGRRDMPDLVPPPGITIRSTVENPQLHDFQTVIGLGISPYCEPAGRIAIDEADAEFIAASPTIVAELLADRTALTARLEAVERENARLRPLARCVHDEIPESCAHCLRQSARS